MNKHSTALIILVLVFFALLAVNTYWFLSIMGISDEIKDMHAAINLNSSYKYGLDEIKEQIVDLESKKVILEEVFIDDSEIVDLIERIEGMAEGSGAEISINSVDVDNQQGYSYGMSDSDMVGSLDLAFSVKGTWQQVNEFIIKVENIPQDLRVTSLALDRANNKENNSESGNNGQWNAKFVTLGVTR
jgi:Tfp pilus assembly protein PilO